MLQKAADKHFSANPAEADPAGATQPPVPTDPAALIPLEPLLPEGQMDPLAVAAMEPGERLLWTGRPRGTLGRHMMASSLCGPLALLFSIASVCVFAAAADPSVQVDLSLVVSGWLLTLMALPILVLLSVLPAARQEIRTVYALSDRHVLRLREGSKPVRYPVSHVDPLSVSSREDIGECGDLRFTADRDGAGGRYAVAITAIDQVAAVERLLLSAAARSHLGQANQQGTQEHPADCNPAGRRSRASRFVEEADRTAAELKASSPSGRGAVVGRLLEMESQTLLGVAERLMGNRQMLVALGIVGMWRPISAAGARAILRAALSARRHSPERQAGAQALSRLRRPGIGSLVQAAGATANAPRIAADLDHLEDRALAEALADVLLTRDRSAGAEVAKALGCGRRLRRKVLEAWQHLSPPPMASLLALVSNDEGRASAWAAEALGRLAEGEAAGSVCAAAQAGDAGEFAVAVLRAHLGDPSGTDALVERLEHGDEDYRQVAAEAAGRLGAAGAQLLPSLGIALDRERDGETRRAIEAAMGRIQAAVRTAPTELEAAAAPAGSGIELEAAPVPEGSGTEMEAVRHPRERNHA